MSDFQRILNLAEKELFHARFLISELPEEAEADQYRDIAAALRQVASRYDALVEERQEMDRKAAEIEALQRRFMEAAKDDSDEWAVPR